MPERPHAEFRFYAELNAFLPEEHRKAAFPVEVDRARSVKDAIESVGVPHTEVDLILVDAVSVDFAHLLRGGERVAVYPMFESLDLQASDALIRGQRHRASALLQAAAGHARSQNLGAPADVLLRPERLQLVRGGATFPNRLAVKIGVIVNYGDSVLIIGDAAGHTVRVRIAGAQPDAVREGATVTVGWNVGDEHLIARS